MYSSVVFFFFFFLNNISTVEVLITEWLCSNRNKKGLWTGKFNRLSTSGGQQNLGTWFWKIWKVMVPTQQSSIFNRDTKTISSDIYLREQCGRIYLFIFSGGITRIQISTHTFCILSYATSNINHYSHVRIYFFLVK